jgi:hypothetical protein
MEAATIQKYAKLTTLRLKLKAQAVFNKWIRERDKGQQCISCDSYNTTDASHYYSAGKHNNLRFHEDNVSSSCRKCNYYMSGNLIPYRERLIKKIGIERVEKLDKLSKVKTTKNDRYQYIEILTKYK